VTYPTIMFKCSTISCFYLIKDRVVLKSDLENFFQNYHNALEEHHFLPKYIWNCDETMLDGGKSHKKLLCERNGPAEISLEAPVGEHITLLLFTSAAGEWIKPLAIFPLKTLPEFSPQVYEDNNISGQENGWIDGPIFKNYIQNFFVDHIMEMRSKNQEQHEPILLLMDHHSSRNALDSRILWEVYHILLFLIPAHSSHITQPLDLSTNGEFKQKLRERLKYVPGETKGEHRNRLLQISGRVLSRVNNKDTILTGWERSGLWPYNPGNAFRSTAVVERIEQLPISAAKGKRKRGMKINVGQVI